MGSKLLCTLMSRSPCLSQVDLMRSFTFRNSKGSYRGIPIIAANMDTVGTFEMALALHQVGYSLHGMCVNHLLYHRLRKSILMFDLCSSTNVVNCFVGRKSD